MTSTEASLNKDTPIPRVSGRRSAFEAVYAKGDCRGGSGGAKPGNQSAAAERRMSQLGMEKLSVSESTRPSESTVKALVTM
mmetsp:Transcript_19444/g.45984  ORF Transcript_19444/g.45984 Transcript_19444/m.45984 type:complete len:81 (+) Transcript_19444:72-314(+)